MGTPRFEVGAAIENGWRLTRANFWLMAQAAIIFLAVARVPQYVVRQLGGASGIGFSVWIASLVLQVGLVLGLTRLSLRLVDGQPATLALLLGEFSLFFRYLGASLLYGLVVLGGLLLFIVPGIMWAFRFCLYQYALVDRNLGIVASLKASASYTSGARWQLLLLGILCGILNALGFLFFGVGALVTLPVSFLAYATVYRILSGGQPAPVALLPVPPLPSVQPSGS